jgi:hypothetical protein
LTHERYLWDTGFHWGEWLEPGGAPADFGAFVQADKSEVATAYLYRSAATLVRIAGVLGLPEDAWVRYRDIAAGALEAWRREFVREDGTLAVQTQASHVRALAFGLVPSESRPAVASRLAGLVAEAGGHLATGFLSTSYLLPVAGLRPVGAGYRTFEVRPRPGGGITSARACHISPFGPIEVGWRVRGEAMELDVLVPPGTTASVVMPGEAPRDAHPGHHHWG